MNINCVFHGELVGINNYFLTIKSTKKAINQCIINGKKYKLPAQLTYKEEDYGSSTEDNFKQLKIFYYDNSSGTKTIQINPKYMNYKEWNNLLKSYLDHGLTYDKIKYKSFNAIYYIDQVDMFKTKK